MRARWCTGKPLAFTGGAGEAAVFRQRKFERDLRAAELCAAEIASQTLLTCSTGDQFNGNTRSLDARDTFARRTRIWIGAAGDAWFAVDISGETVSCTVPGRWAAGAQLNLEPALKLGDELGGHIVTGHVDGVGEVVGICAQGASLRVGISAPKDLAPYIAAKGSITVDGVSLTVNEVADQADGSCHFALNLIPHTSEVTTLGDLAVGSKVNLEIDVLARYLQRMQSLRG